MDFGDDLNTWVTGEFNKLCWSLLKLIKANQLKTTDAQFPGKGFSNKWHKGTVTCTKMKNNFNHLPTGPILTLLHIHIRIYFFFARKWLRTPKHNFFFDYYKMMGVAAFMSRGICAAVSQMQFFWKNTLSWILLHINTI